MTTQEKAAAYEELVAAIVRAVPEIVQHLAVRKGGVTYCKFCGTEDWDAEEMEPCSRPITLEDVLRALPFWVVQIVIGKDGHEAFFRDPDGDLSQSYWHLGHDLAWHRDNAPETIAFLRSLLCDA